MGMFGKGRGTLGEVWERLGTHLEVLDVSGVTRGGPARVGGFTWWLWTGRGTVGEV